jgi:ligand-binding sensor domain-containing protein
MRQFYLVLLALGVFLNTSAQQWTTYTTTNTSFGLSSNRTHAIVIDHQNNKWVGTEYGVCKYDGTTWTQFNIFNSGNAYALTVDPSGNVWAWWKRSTDVQRHQLGS